MNPIKSFGFAAHVKSGNSVNRTSVMMSAAAPTVSGEISNTEALDISFFDKKFGNPLSQNPYVEEIMKNAKFLASPGKGILATDESNKTIGLRFETVGVENTYENRTQYRSMLYRNEKVGEYLSGAIMYDETARATDTVTGKTNIKLLNDNGLLAGVKIDIGLRDIPGTNGEVATVGLDDLAEKAAEYYEMGIRFVKWRAVLKIDDATGCPSDSAIMETSHSLARYA